MSGVRLAPSGAATAFTLDGHHWTIEREGAGGAVSGVRRDGQPLKLAALGTARTPMRAADSWTEGALVVDRIRGTPRAGIAPADTKGGAPTLKMIGVGSKGYDAVGTAAPADEFVLEGDLTVRGGQGGIAIRASNGRDAVRGALLVVTPGGRAALVTSDDAGAEATLGAPVDVGVAAPVHVKVTVRGTKVEAIVGASTLTGDIPAALAKGEVGLVARQGAAVDLAGFTLKKR